MNINIDNIYSIRKTLPSDIDFVIKEETKDENKPFIGQWSKEVHLNSLMQDDVKHLIIEENLKPVGYLILTESYNKKVIEIKRVVITLKNKGIGKLVLESLLKYYFTNYESERIWLDVRMGNKRGQHLYKKIGFKKEGVLRKSVFTGTDFEDLIILSILKEDYFNRKLFSEDEKNQLALLNKLHSETSVKELQEYFYEILEIRGFSSQTIKDKIMLLIEEVGELAKAIRKNEKDSLIDRSKISDSDTIESEVADVFIILISICNLLNIDLFQSILGKEKINSGRKWETL